MSPKIIVAFFAFIILLSLEVSTSSAQSAADQYMESMLARYDPLLLKRAEEKGIYDRDEFPVWRGKNPFYIWGDFNGDGEKDIAFWITKKGTELRGVAIIHSTMDKLYVFGAGEPGNYGQGDSPEVGGDTWHLIYPGKVYNRARNNVPEIGVEEGKPFTIEQETLGFVYLARSAYLICWKNGKYWTIWLSD